MEERQLPAGRTGPEADCVLYWEKRTKEKHHDTLL